VARQGVQLLHLLDVVDEFPPKAISCCHVRSFRKLRSSAMLDPAHHEPAELASAERGASGPRVLGRGAYLVDEGRKRRPVDQREALPTPLEVERPADQGADADLTPRAHDELPDARHRWQKSSRTLHPPGAFEVRPCLIPTTSVVGRGITSCRASIAHAAANLVRLHVYRLPPPADGQTSARGTREDDVRDGRYRPCPDSIPASRRSLPRNLPSLPTWTSRP
jgi:hypothetical protein